MTTTRQREKNQNDTTKKNATTKNKQKTFDDVTNRILISYLIIIYGDVTHTYHVIKL